MVASHHPPTRSSPPCSTPILVLAGLGCWYAGTQPFPMNLVNGLRVTTAAEAILAAARDLGVLDLVILGDSALRLLRIDGTRRIHEYDGARHRETDVHEVDLERDRALLGERWERHGFTSKHLRRDGATIIADADRLLGRAWNPRSAGCRGRACSTLLDHSLLGWAGRARAYCNWRRATAETGQMQQGDGQNLGGT